jgi:hypothetical protein
LGGEIGTTLAQLIAAAPCIAGHTGQCGFSCSSWYDCRMPSGNSTSIFSVGASFAFAQPSWPTF